MAGNPMARRIRDARNRMENQKRGDLAQANACPQRGQGPTDSCPRAALLLCEKQRRVLRHGCGQKSLIATDLREEWCRENSEGQRADGCLDPSNRGLRFS